MASRFHRRVTIAPLRRREPIATSLWPVVNGATNGRKDHRLVERSTSMYATTSASEADQAALSARPRPFSSRRNTDTRGSSAASRRATVRVPSVEALSAITTDQR